MKKLHLAVGIALLLVFVSTGAFMKWEQVHGDALDPLYRMMHRSRHIYILFAGLIHLMAYRAHDDGSSGSRSILLRISSGFLFASAVLFSIAFLVEPQLHRVAAPVTFFGVLLALIGVLLPVVSGFMRK